MSATGPYDRLPAICIAFDDAGTVQAANAECHAALGYVPGTLAGVPLDRVLQPASRIFVQTHVRPLLLVRGEVREVHLVLRAADGAARPVLGNAVRTGTVTEGVFLSLERRHEFEAQLVAARRAADEALEARGALLEAEAARGAELERLLADLRAVIERLDAEHASTSRAVARSLHEQVAQDIAALKLGLQGLQRATTTDALGAQLESLASVAGRSLAQVRSLSYDLYPPQLEHGTLAGALRPAIAAFEATTSVDVEFEVPAVVPATDVERRLVLYRFVEEALAEASAARGARHVAVRIGAAPDLRLEVSVDAAPGAPPAFDVARVRIARLGGRLDLSCPERGGFVAAATFDAT